MDLQTIFSEAVTLQSQGKLHEAREKYLLLLEQLPENINILGNI